MSQKVSLTLTDDLAQRLSWLADHYDCEVLELINELIEDGAHICETAIHDEACEQIRYLAQTPAAGRA
jgi:predicted transcriptional regulator